MELLYAFILHLESVPIGVRRVGLIPNVFSRCECHANGIVTCRHPPVADCCFNYLRYEDGTKFPHELYSCICYTNGDFICHFPPD
uniref:Uncharacterized protein n=1 Tax=Octopus bimaculoides TaxID=37653 RepID=A0A0L8I6Z6_OCTBM